MRFVQYAVDATHPIEGLYYENATTSPRAVVGHLDRAFRRPAVWHRVSNRPSGIRRAGSRRRAAGMAASVQE
jgi:hypothetical protein